jgi:subtilisin family serine protease
MRPLRQVAACAVFALSIVPGTAGPAAAAAYPRPMSNQWWFTAWQVENKVWPITRGDGVTVAVLDTGVQASIPDLSGVVLPGADTTGVGGDGRTDRDPAPVPGHGTGMASLIASQGGGTGFLGVAPGVKVLPVDVNGDHAADQTVAGLRFAVEHDAKVVDISRGATGPCSDDMQKAIANAVQHDVVVVAAAGNDGDRSNTSEFPADCAGVLAVGAVNGRLRPWSRTQRQPYVTVAGPGVDVGGVLKDGRFHTSEGGTDSAAALVAGAVALVRARFPYMSAREVVQRIIASCRDAGPSGKDDMTGYGGVRPYNALVEHVSKDAPNPVFAAYDKWAKANERAGQAPGSQGNGAGNDEGGGFTLSAPVIFVGGIAALMLIVVGVVWLSRRQRGKTPPPGRPPYGPQAPYGSPPPYGPPDQGPPQGPPADRR